MNLQERERTNLAVDESHYNQPQQIDHSFMYLYNLYLQLLYQLSTFFHSRTSQSSGSYLPHLVPPNYPIHHANPSSHSTSGHSHSSPSDHQLSQESHVAESFNIP